MKQTEESSGTSDARATSAEQPRNTIRDHRTSLCSGCRICSRGHIARNIRTEHANGLNHSANTLECTNSRPTDGKTLGVCAPTWQAIDEPGTEARNYKPRDDNR